MNVSHWLVFDMCSSYINTVLFFRSLALGMYQIPRVTERIQRVVDEFESF